MNATHRLQLSGWVVLGVLALAAAPTPLEGQGQSVRAVATDLRSALAPGWLLQDRNGDDVIDFIRGRVLVPAAAGVAELVVAANVGARLGYETSATSLDLVGPDTGAATYEQPVILIGAGLRTRLRGVLPTRPPTGQRAAAAGAGVTTLPGVSFANELGPGEGSIAFVPTGAVLRAGGVAIEGGDASGLLAAGAYFSGRYPAIWSMRDATYDSVADRIARFLDQRGIRADTLTIDRVVVEAGRPGVSRVEVSVALADSATFERVLAALERDSVARPAGAARDTVQSAPRAVGAAATPQDTARRVDLRRGDLQFQDLHRVDVHVRAPGRNRIVRLLPARPWQTRAPAAFSATPSPDFTLADLYTIRGLYRDTNQDLVPDRTDAFLSVHGGDAPRGLVHLATRMGLETAGLRFPLASVGGQDDYPQDSGFPIVFGLGHYQTERLRREGRLHGATEGAGTGFIQFTPRGFAGRHGLVISGSDAAGVDAIAGWVAERMPYLWEYGKGNYRLADAETEVRRFFQAGETAGQVALAVHKLDAWLERLKGKPIDSLAVEVAAKERPAGLDRYIDRMVRERFPGAKTSVSTYQTGFGAGKPIFTQDVTIPWEVDSFWQVFRSSALPKLSASSRGRIELRVSESPQLRERLEREIRSELAAKGVAAGAFDVSVLSAYKQGYSWLHDDVLPRLRGRSVGGIEIRYHSLKDSKEVRWQTVESDTRWLQEIYPIDAVLARELGIADSLITFVATEQREPIYTVTVRDAAGREILRDTFAPKYVVRPYFDLFPEYEQVRVTTGWVTVQSNGELILDQRIKTDPESFWELLQTGTYAKIIEYAMDVQEGRPSPGNAPYFDELRIELTLSEPHYRIGVDEEVISSLEALHEDIYFETLTLFDLIGGRYGVGSLSYAGRVLPYIRPPVDGQPGRARITMTGKERGVPRLMLVHRERGREPVRQRYDLTPLPVDPPKLRGATVRVGAQGVAQLLFDVVAIDSIDRYDEYRERAAEEQIDRTFLPVTLLAGMVDVLRDLHGSRILEDALSWDRVAETAFHFVLRDTTSAFGTTVTLERSTRPESTVRPVLADPGYRWAGERIVQWATPIPPAENDRILAKLATFPGVRVYWAGRSFLGQDIYAADFLPDHDAKYISQAKLNALKPTLLLSGRQHANEVSSTSHILRLGELLATDTSYSGLLKKVNVVLHPITNPDGARLAWEMQLVNPDFMLHAGYLGALGVDVTSGAGTVDPIYPESRVRPELQETWLPDIYMNLHGYPSHEWVQLFAGYSAWVRGRTGTQRTWWAPRGWFVPGFAWVDDARYPELGTAQFAILDSVAAAITRQPDVEAMNRRMYARYQKYGKQDVENFREYFHKGILVYSALRGRDATGQGTANPRVTYFSVTTEAPDETARGDWLELVGTAGLAHTSALLRYLASGVNDVRRETAEFEDFVTRSVARRKPVLPRRE